MKSTIIFAIYLCASISLFSQTQYQIEYTYDETGNRATRELVEIVLKSNTDTTAFNEPDNEVYSDKLGEYEVSIFPNPTKGHLVIEVTGDGIPPQSTMELYSLNGELLYFKKGIDPSTILDLSDKQPGTYLLKIKLRNKSNTWKVIRE
ncbi:MAG: T9SS type A sorting domain-containing protein [Bacteroidales bacterium]|nr:T9SS type A sorting domain-containing protein [Bacteroidales bacterium]